MKKLFIFTIWICVSLLGSAWAQRNEYPRPQFQRDGWLNLNGYWTYQIDPSGSGIERNFKESKGFGQTILVPFSPESKLSGVEYKDFIEHLWYQRMINIPAEWEGKKILLNFGGVYYESEIFVDGKFVDRHFGGSSSFTVDLTEFVHPGQEHSLVVYVKSNLKDRMQPAGSSLPAIIHTCATIHGRPESGKRSGWKRFIRRLYEVHVSLPTSITLKSLSNRIIMRWEIHG